MTERLVFGHLSVVTSLACAPRLGQPGTGYIITSDFDEKVRVGRYPAMYVTEGFCLAAKSFVTNLCVLTDQKDRLVSGGDCSDIWLWDFPRGQLLDKLNLRSVAAYAEAPVPLDKDSVGSLTYSSGFVAVSFVGAFCHRVVFLKVTNDKLVVHSVLTMPGPVGSITFDSAHRLWVTMSALSAVAVFEFDSGSSCWAENREHTMLAIVRAHAPLVSEVDSVADVCYQLRRNKELWMAKAKRVEQQHALNREKQMGNNKRTKTEVAGAEGESEGDMSEEPEDNDQDGDGSD